MSNYKKKNHPFKASVLHDALRHIEDGMARKKQEESLKTLFHSLFKSNNIRCSEEISKSTMEMLHRHGIILSILPEEFKEFRIGSFAQTFTGIGIKNVEDGICFYLDTFGRVIFIGTNAHSFIPVEPQRKTSECIIFYDITDYLAYLTAMTHSKGSVGKPAYDVIILNDFKNIIPSQELVLNYKNINTFLPRGESFDAIINTYQHLSDNRVSDCSWFYQKKGYDTFLEFCEETFGDKSLTIDK